MEVNLNWDIILPIILALLASSPGIFALVLGRKKDKADAAATIVSSSLALMEKLEEKQTDLETDISDLKIVVQDLKKQIKIYRKNQNALVKGIRILICQLEENDIVPLWRPSSDLLDDVEKE